MLSTVSGDPLVRPEINREDNRDRATGAFLACLNHEVRTPLSGIIGMVDLLLETALDDEQREYVQATRVCAEHLHQILNSALEYSALEAGQYTLEDGEFSLRQILESAIASHESKAREKGIEIGLVIDLGLPETLLGDGTRLKDLVGHLLSNAVKFTHAGHISVRASVREKTLVLSVKDTGVGIPPERLGSIFESFRQGETGLSRSYSGLGLGLAVVQKLTALMRGQVRVESQLGSGSAFSIELPLRQPGGMEPATGQSRESAESSGPIIMAVDDNPVGLKVLRHMLGRRHYRVDCFESAQTALEAAAARRYDLVLMDLQMPEMDGVTATIEMRKLPGYQSVPILALTANYSDQVRERCRQSGMQAFLTKPVESEELLAALGKFLKRDAA
jgi:CheY-like chemotaxis protein/two-component sensor histidine kinase